MQFKLTIDLDSEGMRTAHDVQESLKILVTGGRLSDLDDDLSDPNSEARAGGIMMGPGFDQVGIWQFVPSEQDLADEAAAEAVTAHVAELAKQTAARRAAVHQDMF